MRILLSSFSAPTLHTVYSTLSRTGLSMTLRCPEHHSAVLYSQRCSGQRWVANPQKIEKSFDHVKKEAIWIELSKQFCFENLLTYSTFNAFCQNNFLNILYRQNITKLHETRHITLAKMEIKSPTTLLLWWLFSATFLFVYDPQGLKRVKCKMSRDLKAGVMHFNLNLLKKCLLGVMDENTGG